VNLFELFQAMEDPDVWSPERQARSMGVVVRTQWGQFGVKGVSVTADKDTLLIETEEFEAYLLEAADAEDPDVLLTPKERIKDFALYTYMCEESQFSQLLALWTEFDGAGDLTKFAKFVANRCTEPQGDERDVAIEGITDPSLYNDEVR
jgi:hypothetical protein